MRLNIGDTCVAQDKSLEVWNLYLFENIKFGNKKTEKGWVMYGQTVSKTKAIKLAKELANKKDGIYLGVDCKSKAIL